MTDKNEVVEYIFQKTKIIYPPKQSLATFGITNIYYYLACPIIDKQNKVRLREGNVTAEIPKIIPPLGLDNMRSKRNMAKILEFWNINSKTSR